jgi:hypothetical protein
MDTGFARLTPFSAPPTTRTRGESEKPRSDLATKLTALGGTAKNLARHDSSDSPKAPAPSPQRKVLKREPEERKAGKAVSDSLVAVDRAASYRRVRLEGRGVAAKTDPVFKLEDGEGRSCCQVSVPFDSPESIKVRENLERKLAQATDTKYQVSFKRTLQKTLEIRFVPQLRSQDLDCPEKVIKALLADQSCSRIEAINRLDRRKPRQLPS